MTTLMHRPQPWSVQPGWGIVVDLTPPELLNTRQVRVLRKAMIAGFALVLVLCVGGYLLAVQARSKAEDDLAGAQSATTQLQAQTKKYADVTKIQGTVTQVRAQVSRLMSGDVALDSTLDKVRAALPKSMTIDQLSVTVSLTGVAAGQDSAGSIDRTGHTRIGNINISGKSHAIADISAFVINLETIPGLLDVVPTSNSRTPTGGQYVITLGIDDRLLSHRFDVTKGAK